MCQKGESVCFFCDKADKSDTLHEASSFQMDARVRECAQTLQDKFFWAKLSAGDLVAQEAKYHAVCLALLYQKGKLKSSCYSHEDDTSQSVALAELIEYIEDYKLKSNTAPIFNRLYATRLEQMGVSPSGTLHSTYLKERLLRRIPGLKAYTEDRDVLLAYDKDIGIGLKKAEMDNCDNEASHIIQVAKMVRSDMFQLRNTFEGSFSTECQDDSVPDSLVALVAMLLEGPSIPDQNEVKATSQQVLSIAQLIKFNCRNRLSKEQKALYHTRDHETPLPIYIGLDVYAQTRKWELVETFSPWVAEFFLKMSHVRRTRHAHQVTACSLYILPSLSMRVNCHSMSGVRSKAKAYRSSTIGTSSFNWSL